MKHTFLPLVLFLVMAPLSHAELFMEQAQNAVNMFNAMNNGAGYMFTHKTEVSAGYSSLMTTKAGTDEIDLSAYTASYAAGDQFFRTFCVEPEVITSGMVRAKLDYSNGTTTTVNGDSLSIGGAALYAMYISGTLDGYSGSAADTTQLLFAIRGAMETYSASYDYSAYDWSTNVFLSYLLDINDDIDYWKTDYDPGQYYAEVGDYSIFVMRNVEGDGFHRQNLLYAASNDGHAATPEPASILIVGIGLASAFTVARRRKKNS